VLPDKLKLELLQRLARAKLLHQTHLAESFGQVYLPHALVESISLLGCCQSGAGSSCSEDHTRCWVADFKKEKLTLKSVTREITSQ